MKRALVALGLALLLTACGDFTGGAPTPTPTTLVLTTCTANVPVTDAADGDTACTAITVVLP
jgi:hypothetical protein